MKFRKLFVIFAGSWLLAGTSAANKWTLESKHDPETKLDSVVMKLHQGSTTFLIACDQGESTPWGIAVNKADENFDGSPMFRSGIIKFDGNPAESNEWAYMGTMAFPNFDARRLLDPIGKSKRLLIRLQRTNRTKIDVNLYLSGSSTQIKKLKSACLKIGIQP
ncbi:MAG: hypothetical protein ABL909_10950 [Sphingopyxis sp.]